MVSNHCPELAQAGVEWLPVNDSCAIAGHDLDIGAFDTRPQMRLIAKNRISDITEVRHFRMVKQKTVLEFARITYHATVSDDHIFPKISVVAQFTIPPDNRRPFDHHSIFNDCAFPNKNLLANMRVAFETAFTRRTQIGPDVILELLQSIPCVGTIFKKHNMFGLREIKKVSRSKHLRKNLGQSQGAARTKLSHNTYLAEIANACCR